MVVAQEAPYLGDSRVVVFLQKFLPLLFGIHHHAAELVDEEGLAAKSDALLFVDG